MCVCNTHTQCVHTLTHSLTHTEGGWEMFARVRVHTHTRTHTYAHVTSAHAHTHTTHSKILQCLCMCCVCGLYRWSDACVCLSVCLRSQRTVSFWRAVEMYTSIMDILTEKQKYKTHLVFSLFFCVHLSQFFLKRSVSGPDSVLPRRGSKILLNLNSTLQNVGIVNKLSMSPKASPNTRSEHSVFMGVLRERGPWRTADIFS
jgi:hypothetical protein